MVINYHDDDFLRVTINTEPGSFRVISFQPTKQRLTVVAATQALFFALQPYHRIS